MYININIQSWDLCTWACTQKGTVFALMFFGCHFDILNFWIRDPHFHFALGLFALGPTNYVAIPGHNTIFKYTGFIKLSLVSILYRKKSWIMYCTQLLSLFSYFSSGIIPQSSMTLTFLKIIECPSVWESWYFLIVRLTLYIFGRNVTEMLLCSSQPIV